MKVRLFVLLAVLASLAAGCGSSGTSGSGQGADPARLVPASAPVFLEATVRPDGSLGDNATAALKKLLQTDDPGAKLIALFDKAGRRDGLSWNDVEPWLGKRVGVFFTDFAASAAQGAAVLDAKDTGKARAGLVRLLGHGDHGPVTLVEQHYRGVELQADTKDDNAVAIIGDSAVLGSIRGVHAVVDVSKGARPLSDVADYVATRRAVGADGALALAYGVPQGVLDLVEKAQGSASSPLGAGAGPANRTQMLAIARQVLARAGRTLGVALQADGSAVRLKTASLGAPAGSDGGAAAGALAALPSDAWLAAGLGDIGTSLTRGLTQLSRLTAGPAQRFDIPAALRRFKQRTGVDIRRDFLSWMGTGAIYVRGTGLTDIGGALTVVSKDPAKSHRAVGVLGRALAKSGAQVRPATVPGYDTAIQVSGGGSPIALLVAAGGDHFSVGINPDALAAVLKPSARLSDAPSFAAAVRSLGADVKPVLLLDIPTIVNLLETFGVGNQPDFAKVKPYLDALGPLSVGTGRDGDVARATLALGLR